jgi:hypothetical protein
LKLFLAIFDFCVVRAFLGAYQSKFSMITPNILALIMLIRLDHLLGVNLLELLT